MTDLPFICIYRSNAEPAWVREVRSLYRAEGNGGQISGKIDMTTLNHNGFLWGLADIGGTM